MPRASAVPATRRALAALAFAVSLPLAAPSAHAQPAQGDLQIIEPREWQGGTRGISVQQRQSIRVVGMVQHPGGIRQVTLNGVRASLQTEPGGAVRFTGYVPVRQDTRTVDVVAQPATGLPIRRAYDVTPAPAPGGRTYAEPEQAFSGGQRFKGKRWAVVVGVSQYQDANITPLRFADADARAFYDFLRSERAGLGGFAEENVKLLLNEQATYRNLRSALFTFLKSATEDDVVVIYFAGHGMADPERPDNLYLLAADTEARDIAGSGFPMKDVSEAVRSLYARNVVVITDACHSAGVGGQVARRNNETNLINQMFLDGVQGSTGGSVIFTASQANQFSEEDRRWGGGHGVFTYYLLDGLYGAADDDGDRIVTLGEMMEYTRDRVRRDTRNAQIPSISQTAFDDTWPMSMVLGGPAPWGTVAAGPQPARNDPPRDPAVTRGADEPVATGPRALRLGTSSSSTLDAGDARMTDESTYEDWTLAARAGERVAVTMTSTAFDTYLTVSSPDGSFLRMDDDAAGGTNARVVFTAPSTGLYTVRANALTKDGLGAYTLRVDRAASGDRDTPAPQDVDANARPIRMGGRVESSLDARDPRLADGSSVEAYLLELRQGERVSVTMRSSDFDPYLIVAQRGGGFSRNDDDGAGGDDARVTFTAPEAGTYVVRANSVTANAAGAYTLEVSGGTGGDTPAERVAAKPLRVGETATSSLNDGDQVASDGTWYEDYAFQGRRGQAVTIELRSTAFDTYLHLSGPDFWAANDDASSGSSDSRLAIVLPVDGEYRVRANALREGAAGEYTLRVSSTGINAPNVASTAKLPTVTAGRPLTGALAPTDRMLSDSTYYDEVQITGRKGQSMAISLTAGTFDAFVAVYLPGSPFFLSDDDGGGGTNSKLLFAFPEDGTYVVRVNTIGKLETGAYTLNVEQMR
jgi:hypothetical protein